MCVGNLFRQPPIRPHTAGQSIAVDGALTSGRDRLGDLNRNVRLANNAAELEILRRLRDVAPEQRMMQLMARRMMARQAAQGASKEGKRTAKANL